jgi:sulfur relay (sulfurtransferase) complex TusBCD TusD component (DsrE family)
LGRACEDAPVVHRTTDTDTARVSVVVRAGLCRVRSWTPKMLLALPVEISYNIAWRVLAMDLSSALHLCNTCHTLRTQFSAMKSAAEKQRLHFDNERSMGGLLASNDSVFTRQDSGSSDYSLAVCQELPIEGLSSVRVLVERDRTSVQHWTELVCSTGVSIGVCDAARRNMWLVNTQNGELLRRTRRHSTAKHLFVGPLPQGYPDGDRTAVFCCHHYAAEGDGDDDGELVSPIVEVIVNHDTGTLAFRVGELPPICALSGFPRGLALRPCVLLYQHGANRVSLVGQRWRGAGGPK